MQPTIENYIKKHQNLVDIMLEYKNEKGICEVTQQELADRLKVKQTTISKYIRQINKEGTNIIYTGNGYYIRYENIIYGPTHKTIMTILYMFINEPNTIIMNEIELAKKIGCKRETIQSVKTLLKMEFKKNKCNF